MSPPTSVTIEIYELLTASTWTDVTSFVEWRSGYSIRAGGSDPLTSPTEPGSLQFTLRNQIDETTLVAPFTPDSPVSPYYPNITKGKRVRARVVVGGNTYTRFDGWITSFTPSWPDGRTKDGLVDVVATDVIGMLQDISAQTRVAASCRYRGVLETTAIDVWTFEGADTAKRWANLGLDGSQNILDDSDYDARVIIPSGKYGQASPGGTDGPVSFGASVRLTQDTSKLGPVIVCPTQDVAARSVGVFWRVEPADSPGATFRDLAGGWTDTGVCKWRLGLVVTASESRLELRNASLSTLIAETHVGNSLDGRWHCALVVSETDGSLTYLTDEDAIVFGGSALDSRGVRHIVVGGYMNPLAKKVQTNCLVVEIGPVWVSHGSTSYYSFDYAGILRDDYSYTPNSMLTALLSDPAISDVVGVHGSTTTGTGYADRRVNNWSGGARPCLEVFREIANSSGSVFFGAPDGQFVWRWADYARPTTPALTITAEADDDASSAVEWTLASGDQVGHVTVTWTEGEVTAHASGVVSGTGDVTVPTILYDYYDARALAKGLLLSGGKLRPASVTIDLVNSATDRWAAAFGTDISERVRLDGIPGGTFGFTRYDGYVRSRLERYAVVDGRASYQITYDLDAADDPPEVVIGTDEYSRVGFGTGGATITGGTAVGIVGTGTVIITSSAGRALTTDATMYPMDLEWNGEGITIGAPGGATSPQTCTVSARGANGTVARVHAAGEVVEVWHAARVAR